MTHLTSDYRIKLILASQSPARLSTLKAAGITPSVTVSRADEAAIIAHLPESSSHETVMALAQAKGKEVYQRLNIADSPEPTIVIGADSMLEINGQLVGKPHTLENARKRWQEMRNQTGILHTGHCVLFNPATSTLTSSKIKAINPIAPHLSREDKAGTVTVTASESTTIHFGDINETDLNHYLESKEPLQVAGAFTVDGLGGAFVDRIEGDYHSVVGISLPLLRRILNQEGIPWTALWNY